MLAPTTHLLSNARRRLLAAAVAATGAFVPLASCAHLSPENNAGGVTADSGMMCSAASMKVYQPPSSTDQVITLDGGADAAMGDAATADAGPAPMKMACGDSTEQLPHTPGIQSDGTLLDISQATGYTPDSTVPGKAAALLASTADQVAQLTGPPWTQDGVNPQFLDIYRTLDTADG